MICRLLMVALVGASLSTAVAVRSAQAHHSGWGLPLVGGLVGGYAAKSLLDQNDKPKEEARPAPAPAAAPAAPTATSIEDKLNTLDKLAAGGYITKDEYTARRQALLNEL